MDSPPSFRRASRPPPELPVRRPLDLPVKRIIESPVRGGEVPKEKTITDESRDDSTGIHTVRSAHHFYKSFYLEEETIVTHKTLSSFEYEERFIQGELGEGEIVYFRKTSYCNGTIVEEEQAVITVDGPRDLWSDICNFQLTTVKFDLDLLGTVEITCKRGKWYGHANIREFTKGGHCSKMQPFLTY